MDAQESQHDEENPRRRKKARTQSIQQRQRAVRACDECRRLKEKCEDGMPCRRCKHLRRQCEFNVAPTAEKRSPAFTDSVKEVLDRAHYTDVLLRHHLPHLDLSTESLRRACEALSMPSPDIPRSSQTVQTTLSAGPQTNPAAESPPIEDEGCTLDNVDGITAHYSGEFSHWNFSMHVKRNIDDLMAKSNVPRTATEHIDQIPTYIRVGEAHPDSSSIAEIVALLPPRPVAEFLKRVVFKHGTGTYFLVELAWIDSMMETLYTSAVMLRAKDVTAACVVVMVLAVGTQYAHLESSQRNPGATSEVSNSWELDIGSAFYQLVAKLLAEIIHSGSLLSVQACLLLGLYSLPVDASGLGYIYLNLAIKLAIQNGMHRRSEPGAFSPGDEHVRRRVWWSAYCMERKIGIYHGRPASIHRDDVDVDLPSDQHTAVNSPASFSALNLLQSIYLTNQAEAFLHEISLLRRCKRSDMEAIFRRIKHLKVNTEGWRPSSEGMAMSKPASTRPEMHSRLDRCLLEMFIGRPFILLHRQRNVSNGSQGHTSNITSSTQPDAEWEFLVRDCVDAAKEAITMCHAMQTGSLGLARSSYVEYSSCRAALLVLIAYSICYHTNEFAVVLQNGLRAMREMASASESARSEVSLLETLESSLRRLRESKQPPGNIMVLLEPVQESYEGFADWYKNRSKTAGVTPTTLGSEGAQGIPTQSSDSNATRGGGYDVMSIQNEPRFDSGPFDFDFLGDAAFPTPDYGQYSNLEKEFLDSLLWIQD
ncbi:hypothetical protein LTR62_001953 [Meristemomyces frigidus]|uniref:Zn(2)-C6 fungal-type domain-containing protein n=1 Tax=Meristemomyces frigidus TaxID=1508187 RepID=A0AAN7YM52_9PEZI|nr:hypothetical protein LTR62_001953 [Meristemomyces frigidus]